jgi:CubicO group peptidase (beta-lactamase class C family)
MVASATKPIVASAVWQLLADGSLALTDPVADHVPGFGEHGKGAVTVEQVLLMTCGFPSAPMSVADGIDRRRRREQFASWELEYEPGTRYAYHAASAHWVLAELLEHVTGDDFRDVIEQRVTRPLGLPRVLGIARGGHDGIAQLALPPLEGFTYDRVEMIEAGVPGAGGVMTAATLARFYQALLHDPAGLWDPAVLADGTGNVRCTLPDPVMGMPANRTIGVVVGNGFGSVWGSSPTAFGWPGMGGQVGFAEPATGVSFAFLQAGDPDPQHAFVRALKLSGHALALGR